MSLVLTDYDGRRYVFDDSQKNVVRRLTTENTQLRLRVFELEVEKDILEVQLRRSRSEAAELIEASIAPLDPDHP